MCPTCRQWLVVPSFVTAFPFLLWRCYGCFHDVARCWCGPR
jgi:hypothetical protein